MRGNLDQISVTPERKKALMILEAGLEAIDTRQAVHKAVKYSKDKDELTVQQKRMSLKGVKNVVLVGFGKAAFDACQTLYDILDGRVSCGFVLDLKGGVIGNLTCSVGTHPFPTTVNVRATQDIKTFLDTLTEDDLVLCVVSGGGSSLLCDPYQMTCEMQTLVVKALMHRGANIEEVNTVRKHLDNVKGGQLAEAAYPAKIINLVFSDVPDGTLDMVASGPTMYDETTLQDAQKVMEKYGVLETCRLPSCQLVETPKEKKFFERIDNFLLVDSSVAVEAMKTKAVDLGLKVNVGSKSYSGEARELGVRFLEQTPKGYCSLWAGESTVTVKNPGKGGRNLELSLGALPHLEESQLVLALNTDGFDNTPFAGAIADAETLKKARQLQLDPKVFLEQNSSYSFFEQTGDFLDTGLTGSNIADLVIVFS